MVSKKKRTNKSSTLRRKFNNKKNSINKKKVIRKKNISHKGGMLGKVAAAGLLGTAAAQASGVNIGEMLDSGVQNATAPIKNVGAQIAENAKSLTSAVGKTLNSIKQSILSNAEELKKKIKGNSQLQLHGRTILDDCKNLKNGTIEPDNFEKKLRVHKDNLFNILACENSNNRDIPFFFDILRQLGYDDNLKSSLYRLIELSNFNNDNNILMIVDKNESNCFHYCCFRGIYNPLEIILENFDFLGEHKEFSLRCLNKKNLNPLHYALKSNHKDTPHVIKLLIDNDIYNSYKDDDNNFDNRNQQYSSFLLNNKHKKKNSLINEIMIKLIENNFQLPIGKDFTDTNSYDIFSFIKDYIEKKELQYSLQLSHLNDHSVNFYQCPSDKLPEKEIVEDNTDDEDDFNYDESDTDNDDIDEDGHSLKKLDKEITVYESIKDIMDLENDNLRNYEIKTTKVPAEKMIILKRKEGDYQKIKYGPITGWIRRLELLKDIK